MESLEKPYILCVDDERNVLSSLKRFFLDDDYEILTATSGEEGLGILETQGPCQIIISDYRMPVMDGVEFLRKVYQRWPETVRIVLSGYADAGAIVAAINDGHIYKFIPKPWNDDELRATVDNALERYALQKRNRELMAALSIANSRLEHTVQKRTDELETRHHALTFSQSMIDSLPFAVIGIDAHGMIVQGSRLAVQIFNDAPGGFLGSDRRETLPVELNRMIDTLKDGETTQRMWYNDGICYDTRATKFCSFDHSGVVIALVAKSDMNILTLENKQRG